MTCRVKIRARPRDIRSQVDDVVLRKSQSAIPTSFDVATHFLSCSQKHQGQHFHLYHINIILIHFRAPLLHSIVPVSHCKPPSTYPPQISSPCRYEFPRTTSSPKDCRQARSAPRPYRRMHPTKNLTIHRVPQAPTCRARQPAQLHPSKSVQGSTVGRNPAAGGE